MTKEHLNLIGLPETATPEEIAYRLGELKESETRQKEVKTKAADERSPVMLKGGVQCPMDIDPKDVVWRIERGVGTQQAIEAARLQKKSNELRGIKTGERAVA